MADPDVELDGSGGDASRAQAVVDEITAAGGTAVASTESVSEWDSAHAIVQTVLDTYGQIDGVVNNAGIVRDRMVFTMSEHEWRAVIDVHLHGSFFVSRAAAPHFKAQGHGSFVHVTSTSGLIGSIGQANYASARRSSRTSTRSTRRPTSSPGTRSRQDSS